MGDGRDDADNAERSVLRERDAVLAANRLRAQEFDARNLVGDHLELFDLVDEPADFSLFQLIAPELLRPVDADLANAGNRLAAVFQTARFKLLLSFDRRGHGFIHVVEDPPAVSAAVGRPGVAVAHVAEHFLHNAANQFVGDLHGGYSLWDTIPIVSSRRG